jgi:hypothetical protein
MEFCSPIINRFQTNLYFLSTQKYSSNVIEKCFEKGYDRLYDNLIEEISYDSKIIDLIRSPFGNYVIQKALKLSNQVHKNRLISLILRDIKKLDDKKLIEKWKLIVNNSQSNDKNFTRTSNYQCKFGEENLNVPNFNYVNSNLISNNQNYNSNSRVIYGSPYLMLNTNLKYNNNFYGNFVNNNHNNYNSAFSINFYNNNMNYSHSFNLK